MKNYAFIVAAQGEPQRALKGLHTDVAQWEKFAAYLGGTSTKVWTMDGSCNHQPYLDDCIADMYDHMSAKDHLHVVVLGHGSTNASGEPGLVLDSGEVLSLRTLADRLPRYVQVTWWLELCGVRAPCRPGYALPPDSRVMSACDLNEVAERRVIDGEWRGAWTWAVHRAMEQALVTDKAGHSVVSITLPTLRDRTTALLRGLDVQQSPQLACHAEDAELNRDSVDENAQSAVQKQAMELDPGIVWVMTKPSNGNAWVSAKVNALGQMKLMFRTGQSASDMPNTLTLSWRAPSSQEQNELGGASITCATTSFVNSGPQPPSNLRLYSSKERKFVLGFHAEFSLVAWWAAPNQVNGNNHLTPWSSSEQFDHVTSMPSAPPMGWVWTVDL